MSTVQQYLQQPMPGAITPIGANPYFSFAETGMAQQAGQAGQFIGGALDFGMNIAADMGLMSPMVKAGNPMMRAEQIRQQQIMQSMMEQQSALERQQMARLFAHANPTTQVGQIAQQYAPMALQLAGMSDPFLAGGAMSQQAMLNIASVGYNPSSGSMTQATATGAMEAFNNIYGFGAGQNVKMGMTGGLSKNELSTVFSYVANRAGAAAWENVYANEGNASSNAAIAELNVGALNKAFRDVGKGRTAGFREQMQYYIDNVDTSLSAHEQINSVFDQLEANNNFEDNSGLRGKALTGFNTNISRAMQEAGLSSNQEANAVTGMMKKQQLAEFSQMALLLGDEFTTFIENIDATFGKLRPEQLKTLAGRLAGLSATSSMSVTDLTNVMHFASQDSRAIGGRDLTANESLTAAATFAATSRFSGGSGGLETRKLESWAASNTAASAGSNISRALEILSPDQQLDYLAKLNSGDQKQIDSALGDLQAVASGVNPGIADLSTTDLNAMANMAETGEDFGFTEAKAKRRSRMIASKSTLQERLKDATGAERDRIMGQLNEIDKMERFTAAKREMFRNAPNLVPLSAGADRERKAAAGRIQDIFKSSGQTIDDETAQSIFNTLAGGALSGDEAKALEVITNRFADQNLDLSDIGETLSSEAGAILGSIRSQAGASAFKNFGIALGTSFGVDMRDQEANLSRAVFASRGFGDATVSRLKGIKGLLKDGKAAPEVFANIFGANVMSEDDVNQQEIISRIASMDEDELKEFGTGLAYLNERKTFYDSGGDRSKTEKEFRNISRTMATQLGIDEQAMSKLIDSSVMSSRGAAAAATQQMTVSGTVKMITSEDAQISLSGEKDQQHMDDNQSGRS